jgi:hypothetical protein
MWLVACADPVAPPPPPQPEPCLIAEAPAEGPLRAKRVMEPDAMRRAVLFIREARLTGDAGFYTMAEVSLDCADARAPGGVEARALRAHLGIQFHRFAEVEASLTPMPADAGWLDYALLGDAQMEQGKLDGAAVAYQNAVDKRPGIEMYDRIGWLRWLEGDVEGALEMAELAAGAGSMLDPEPLAWVLTRLGWLHALRGEPAPEIERALALIPDYPPARFARGRIRLAQGHVGAAADLYADTVESTWARAEVDPTADVERVKAQDSRGYAMWLTERDPAAAAVILDEEWKIRQDATTQMARAYAAWKRVPPPGGAKAGGEPGPPPLDPVAEARTALATGIVEPRVLRMGALILGDVALAKRALAMGPGLLPGERVALESLVHVERR